MMKKTVYKVTRIENDKVTNDTEEFAKSEDAEIYAATINQTIMKNCKSANIDPKTVPRLKVTPVSKEVNDKTISGYISDNGNAGWDDFALMFKEDNGKYYGLLDIFDEYNGCEVEINIKVKGPAEF
jgi:hypothetical protein